jgi:ribosome assembly protein SQT1
MSHQEPHEDPDHIEDEEADEIIEGGDEEDIVMDSGDEDDGMGEFETSIALQNDSSAHFDGHSDSIFCIAQHPLDPRIAATGGGDDVAYVFDSTPEPPPVLPASYESAPAQPRERESLVALAKLEGHTDSVNAIAFSLPDGRFLATAGLDGKLIVWAVQNNEKSSWKKHAETQEVEEINWLVPCPSSSHPNAFALGASDGSVWVYEASKDSSAPLNIVQAYYLHTASCTAGTWTPDGKLLITISEDGSFHAWDPWGEAAAMGLTSPQGGQALLSLSADDERFKSEGGIYSVAISPGGTLAAVGGADGNIKIVALPRLQNTGTASAGKTGKGNQKSAGSVSMGQAGQILAIIDAAAESVETLSFSEPPLTLLAAGSVDGSIVLLDVAHGYAVRRRIDGAHEDQAVIQLQFLKGAGRGNNSWALTSCGNDGVVRRWDGRGGTAAAAKGLINEWKGHRGDGEGGGVLGFVMGADGKRIITAGDE